MNYYGTRLSENISRRPEGYLLCLNVPVARSGTQDYLPEELGIRRAAGKPPGMVRVFRPEEEVFSKEAVASFEGMPVTDGHPPDGVTIGNIRALGKGHAQNIRRGTGAEADLLLADLIITDPKLITGILEGGKREISCGYTYELCEEDGQYIQRMIRGNHVAVVDAGRAGPRVSIKDQQPERRNTAMKKSLSKVLARMAKDGDIETVAGIIEEMLEPEEKAALPEKEEPEAEAAPAAENAETAAAADETTLGDVLSRLDQIISLLTPAATADETPDEIAAAAQEVAVAAEAADPMAEAVEEAMEEILDPVSSVIPDETCEKEPELPETLQTGDALRAALAAVRPALARMPRETRQKTARDIAARLRQAGRRGTTGSDAYAALASACRRTVPASADLGRRIMEKRNANYGRRS